MKALFLAIQDNESHRWSPVARVTRGDGLFKLAYTKGALRAPGFEGFGRMNDLEAEYVSKGLFPLLKNRVLPTSRPEYQEYLGWLGLSAEKHDELEELSRTGGQRATDSIELIPCPEPNESGEYEAYFFARGLRYFPKHVEENLSALSPGDRLFVVRDVQNQHDESAVLLRTREPISLVGYVPRYYSEDFTQLVSDQPATKVVVTVERVNPRAPLPYRLLCRITTSWPAHFSACGTGDFELLSSSAKVREVA